MRLLFMGLISASLAASLAACGNNQSTDEAGSDQQAKSASAAPTELVINTLQEGEGETAQPGQNVTVHYTGWLFDPVAENNQGKKFDSSVDRGTPFSFPLGKGRVIEGWDQGVAGMQIGEKRRLIIPAHLGYGARGAGNVIPGGATLLFDVELLATK